MSDGKHCKGIIFIDNKIYPEFPFPVSVVQCTKIERLYHIEIHLCEDHIEGADYLLNEGKLFVEDNLLEFLVHSIMPLVEVYRTVMTSKGRYHAH